MSRDLAWARSRPASVARALFLHGVLGPAMDAYTRRRVLGTQHLEGLVAPVLFVSNHSSHMDTPALLRALPGAWGRRTAVAAAADYFYSKRRLAPVVALAFNTVPVPRKGAETEATADLVRLLGERWSLVIFAEGTRSRDGRVGRLHSGAAVLAAAHGMPIVPVYVAGTHQTMPVGRRWMRRGPGRRRRPIEIRFGAPVWPQPGEHRTEVMDRVRQFLAASGAETTLDKRIAARERRLAEVEGGTRSA